MICISKIDISFDNIKPLFCANDYNQYNIRFNPNYFLRTGKNMYTNNLTLCKSQYEMLHNTKKLEVSVSLIDQDNYVAEFRTSIDIESQKVILSALIDQPTTRNCLPHSYFNLSI